METIAINKVRPNSENPRYIKDEKFKKLEKAGSIASGLS